MSGSTRKPDTILTHGGRHPGDHHGVVNPPVYRASTVLFPTMDDLEGAYAKRFEPGMVFYGRHGTPTTQALEEALAEAEGAHRAILAPSGVAAIVGALTAHLKSGDHLLMVDSVYAPTRGFCDHVLKGYGVETTYYDPLIGAGIAALMRPNTRVVFTESPGSLTFEVQDIPAIAQAAHACGALVMLDNTWATQLYFPAFAHGVDISIHAGTKYVVGHSDALLGVVATTEATYETTRQSMSMFGYCAGSEETYLALRGLRTMGVRLRRHRETAEALCDWLAARPEVARILYPARPDDPGHALWKRDFTGACGLFGVVLKAAPRQAVAAMLDGFELFGMGFSWGGFESLVIPTDGAIHRTATSWSVEGPGLRFHAGLEDADDLIRDLEAGFARFNSAR